MVSAAVRRDVHGNDVLLNLLDRSEPTLRRPQPLCLLLWFSDTPPDCVLNVSNDGGMCHRRHHRP